MTARLQYGATAKVFHWLIVALLLVQYPIGWLMPDLHRGTKPGAPMTFHISFGITILVLIVLRFAWRLAHPVAPESSLPPWQRLTFGSGALAALRAGAGDDHHRLAVRLVSRLVGVVLLSCAAADAGFRQCGGQERRSTACIRRWNGRCWSVIGIHVAAALAHIFIYRDRIMQRMLPE